MYNNENCVKILKCRNIFNLYINSTNVVSDKNRLILIFTESKLVKILAFFCNSRYTN